MADGLNDNPVPRASQGLGQAQGHPTELSQLVAAARSNVWTQHANHSESGEWIFERSTDRGDFSVTVQVDQSGVIVGEPRLMVREPGGDVRRSRADNGAPLATVLGWMQGE